MNDNGCVTDVKPEAVIRAFLEEMIAVHGCTLQEAFEVVRHEIMGEYDRRVYARRADLRVI